MNKLAHLYLVIVALLIFMAACGPASVNLTNSQIMITGKGPVIDSVVSLTGFDNIKLDGIPTVYLYQGSTYKVRISGNQNLIPLIKTLKEGNSLVINTPHDISVENNNLEVHIQLPLLAGIENKGTGPVETKTDFSCDALSATISGTGAIRLSGRATSINLAINGTGSAYLTHMPAESITIDLSGTGNAEVFPQRMLTGTLNGTGAILYKGNPQVNINIKGTGRVSPF